MSERSQPGVPTSDEMNVCECGAKWDPAIQAHRHCRLVKRKCGTCGGLGFTGRRNLSDPLLVPCPQCAETQHD
jgi:hypothetical protein